jgi:hypothetical protein
MILATALAVMAGGACDLVTDPPPLEDFNWVAVDNVDEIQEGIDAAVFFGEINLLGQVRTPSLCYSLSADFHRTGSDLTVEVTAKSTDSHNCSQEPGGFRYTAVLRHLGPGDYTLHVIHRVPGTDPQEYTEELTI